jgi:hypothetical protein
MCPIEHLTQRLLTPGFWLLNPFKDEDDCIPTASYNARVTEMLQSFDC